jgi:hypothetical protein
MEYNNNKFVTVSIQLTTSQEELKEGKPLYNLAEFTEEIGLEPKVIHAENKLVLKCTKAFSKSIPVLLAVFDIDENDVTISQL